MTTYTGFLYGFFFWLRTISFGELNFPSKGKASNLTPPMGAGIDRHTGVKLKENS